MPVGHQDFRPYPGQLGQVPLGAGERVDGAHVVHVADVLADPGVSAAGERAGVLQVGAGGQHRRHLERQGQRQRRVPPGAADRQLCPGDVPAHRIVARHPDAAVVAQPGVGQRGEPGQRIGVVGDDRLAGQIAGGHHQHVRTGWVAGQPEQQHVQSRVGQHHTQVGIVRCHRVGHAVAGAGAPGQQDDRPADAGEQVLLARRERDQPPGGIQVGGHHSERLAAPALAGTQLGDRSGVAGVAGEVIAAESLDRHDPPGGQQLPGAAQGVLAGGRRAVAGDQLEPRSAVRTGDRLGVEPAVGRIVVLGPARGAHGEAGHRGGIPVVRQPGDDGEPRAAVGARDERVPVPTVGRIAQLAQAVGADRDVGRRQRTGRSVPAGRRDGESGAAFDRQVRLRHRGHHGQRWCVLAQSATVFGDCVRLALDLGHHAVDGVADRSGERQLGGRHIGERPEANALHETRDGVPAPDPVGAGRIARMTHRIARLTHQFQAAHRLLGPGGVDDLQREAHVDQHPVARVRRRVQHADVHPALGADHVDQRQLAGVARHDLHHPAGYAQAHGQDLRVSADAAAVRRPTRVRTASTASGTAAATGSLSPMPSSTSATRHPTT
jgi:hypothetical protein